MYLLIAVKTVIHLVDLYDKTQSYYIFLFLRRLLHLHFYSIPGRRTPFFQVSLRLTLESGTTMSFEMGMNVPGSCAGGRQKVRRAKGSKPNKVECPFLDTDGVDDDGDLEKDDTDDNEEIRTRPQTQCAYDEIAESPTLGYADHPEDERNFPLSHSRTTRPLEIFYY